MKQYEKPEVTLVEFEVTDGIAAGSLSSEIVPEP